MQGREFKFAEVIAFLTDNQELKFISKDKYIVSIENGHLVFTKEWFDESEEWEDLSDYYSIENKLNIVDINIMKNTYTIYEEISPFNALQELIMYGKTIQIKRPHNKTNKTSIITKNSNDFSFSIDDLKNGKWYVIN